MMTEDDIRKLARLGGALLKKLERHHAFVMRTVDKYDQESEGGQLIYAASVLRRELEPLETVLEEPFDFSSLESGELGAAQHVAMARFSALLSELMPTFDPHGHHQSQIRSGWQDLTPHRRKRLEEDVPEIHQALVDVVDLMQAVLTEAARTSPSRVRLNLTAERAPSTMAQAENVGGGQSDGGGGENENNQGDGTMANGDKDVDGIISAISRLQGAGGLGASGSSAVNTYNAFSSELDQRINLTLGMPSLTSDAAQALSSDVLASKLYEGLARTVAEDKMGGVTTFVVNPLRARGATLEGEGMALGAQAISAATIRSLKEPIMANVYKLVPETVIGDQDEAEDLRIAISDGLDKLIAETNADTGIFVDWAAEILVQIGIDLFRLGSLYGILDGNSLPRDLHGFALAFLFEEAQVDVLEKLFRPAFERILRDPDIGILTAEANDRAFNAIFQNLIAIIRLDTPGLELGPLVGRIRALNDTIPASVISARNALAIAGISEADQSVTFSRMTFPGDIVGGADKQASTRNMKDIRARRYSAGGISLRRLLAWIEAESLTARSFFLREDLNTRDIERLKAPREKQLEALNEIIERSFPMVNPNDYAIGRRHLNEVREHLDSLIKLMEVLVTNAERQSA